MELLVMGSLLVVGFLLWTGILGFALLMIGLYGGRTLWDNKQFYAAHQTFRPRWRSSSIWKYLKLLFRYNPPPGTTYPLISNKTRRKQQHPSETQLKSHPLPPGPCIISCQPHGMFALTAALAVFSGDLDSPYGCTRTLLVIHDWYWWVPFLRDLMLRLGCINKEWRSIERALAMGYRVAILSRGVFEMGPEAVPPPDVFGVTYLVHQVKYTHLVPVALGGEEDICWVWHGEPNWLRRFRAWALTLLHLPAGAIFIPRIWAWPKLQPLIGPALDPNAFTDSKLMQNAYNEERDKMLTAFSETRKIKKEY